MKRRPTRRNIERRVNDVAGDAPDPDGWRAYHDLDRDADFHDGLRGFVFADLPEGPDAKRAEEIAWCQFCYEFGLGDFPDDVPDPDGDDGADPETGSTEDSEP